MPNTSTPRETVEAFIAAMNSWEIASSAARRAVRNTDDPSSYQAGAAQSKKALFDVYCTQKPRPYGRLGSFQNPPEYDPTKEQVVSVEVSGAKAIVETERTAILGGGRYQYKLKRVSDGWLIDNCKYQFNGKWEPSIL